MIEFELNDDREKIASVIDSKIAETFNKYHSTIEKFFEVTGIEDTPEKDIESFIFATFINAYISSIAYTLGNDIAEDTYDYVMAGFEFAD